MLPAMAMSREKVRTLDVGMDVLGRVQELQSLQLEGVAMATNNSLALLQPQTSWEPKEFRDLLTM